MSMKPRDLPVFQEPVLPALIMDNAEAWGIAPEGFVTKDSSLLSVESEISLPLFDNLNKQRYFLDIFLGKHQTLNWKATVSHNWICLSKLAGLLIIRIFTTVMTAQNQKFIWANMPQTYRVRALISNPPYPKQSI